jgi:hypothetical protein
LYEEEIRNNPYLPSLEKERVERRLDERVGEYLGNFLRNESTKVFKTDKMHLLKHADYDHYKG